MIHVLLPPTSKKSKIPLRLAIGMIWTDAKICRERKPELVFWRTSPHERPQMDRRNRNRSATTAGLKSTEYILMFRNFAGVWRTNCFAVSLTSAACANSHGDLGISSRSEFNQVATHCCRRHNTASHRNKTARREKSNIMLRRLNSFSNRFYILERRRWP